MSSDGPELSKYVTLVSSDGFEFVVLREAVLVSSVIKGMLDPKSQFAESRTGRCVFEEITGLVLEKAVEYCQYWYKYKESENVPDMDIPVELCLELLQAADFLGLDSSAKTILLPVFSYFLHSILAYAFNSSLSLGLNV
ncbi:Skp1 family protein [Xylaria acuta]|nr:Skp1 family protein [Xylaria acuta]